VFEKINQPHRALKIENIIDGLIEFRKSTDAQMWLEVFILPGYNDSSEHLGILKKALMSIKPEVVQLNTLDRPGTLPDLEPAPLEDLQAIAAFFAPLETEIISSSAKNVQVDSFQQDIYDTILQTLQRRPCTDNDLCSLLGRHRNELNKYIQILVKKNLITREKQKRGDFWRIVH
jgi:wyosine [tRNA(Phe)-imidazoG37] synthetase (radical SAM superfamily)